MSKHLIITMDPGAHKVGLCVGTLEDGPLWASTLDTKSKLKGYALAEETAAAALAEILPHVTKAARGTVPLSTDEVTLVIEHMQADSRTAGAVVGDILACQATGGAFAALCCPHLLPHVLSPTPSEWVKGMPKDVMRRQLVKEYPHLGLETAGHDTVAAVGLFRWAASGPARFGR
jgi:hypothetical protein